MCRARDDRAAQVMLSKNMVQLAIDVGDFRRAEELLEHIRSHDCMDADRYMYTRVQCTAILVMAHRGDWRETWSISRLVLEVATEVGDHEAVAMGLEGCALAIAAGDRIAGARLLGAAEALRQQANLPRAPNEESAMMRCAPALFDALLHDATAQTAHREGRTAGWRDAVTWVSSLAGPDVSARAGEPAARTLRVQSASLLREGDYWTVAYGGRVGRVRHVVGLEHLALLLSRPGVEVHCLELMGGTPGAVQSAPGPLLDSQAKGEYRRRLLDLERDIAQAHADNDGERVARFTAEHDVLVRELARAVGLGGRDRPGSSDAERARVRVTKAVRSAVAGLARVDADLGRHLRASLRTGSFCSYRPSLAEPVAWEVRS